MIRGARLLLLLAQWLVATPASAAPVYALVVGVNRSPDSSTVALRYADDDAVLFHRLLSTAGSSTLLTAPDAATRRLYGARIQARAPTRANLLSAMKSVALRVQRDLAAGKRPQVFFVYSGHGRVRHNMGHLTLIDGELSSIELARRVLEPLRGATCHVIIDACDSYYMVHEKRAGGRRKTITRPFYRPASLTRRFPKVGFILSTSSEAASHEWARFQSGIFSHEVRSGLMGGADVDRDTRVSYNELWAFIQVANRWVTNERFRPHVFMRPPRGNGARTLLDLSRAAAARVTIPASHAGRYHVEDALGVRLADVHFDGSAPEQLWLWRPMTSRRIFIQDRSRGREYALELTSRTGAVSLASLTARQASIREKGAANLAFLQLFSQPFGPRTFELAMADHNRQVQPDGSVLPASIEARGEVEVTPVARRTRGAVAMGYQLRSGYLQQAGLSHGVGARYTYPLGPMDLGLGASYGRSAYHRDDGANVVLDEAGFNAVAELRHAVDWRVTLVLGLEAGLSWASQRAGRPDEPTVTSTRPFFRYQGRAGIELRVAGPLSLTLSGGLGQAVVERQDGWSAPLTGGLDAGFVMEL